ncbi:MAG TPA: hypothetical protein VGU73_12020 [Acidimicrobiia bacterium]|nr:hypothetical protein [Acidimicrobiia bacterium]
MVTTALPARLRTTAWPWGWIGFGVCATALLLGVAGAETAGLVVSLVVLGCALPLSVSLPGRLALAVPVWASLNVTVLPALQAVGVRPSPVPAAGAFALVAVAVRVRTTVADERGSWRADGVSLATGFVVLAGLLTTWVGRGLTTAMTFFMGAPDNATHFYLVRLVADEGGVRYWASTHTTGGASGLNSYPQGFHLNTALAGQVAFGHPTTVARLFDTFALGSYTSAALLVALGGLCAAAVARRCAVGGTAQAMAGVAAAVAIALGPLGFMLTLGFQGQTAAYTLLFAVVLVSLSTPPTTPGAVTARLVVLGLLIAGLSNTYYVILPVVAPLVVFELARLRRSWPGWRVVAPIGVLLGAATLLPVAAGLEGGSFSHLGDQGLVPPLSRLALVALGLVALAGLAVPAVRRAARTSAAPFVLTALAALGLELGILGYQDATLGATRYYYEKAVYTTFLLALVAAAAVGAVLLERLVRSRQPAEWVVAVTVALVGGLVVAGATGVLTAPSSRPLVQWLNGQSRLPASPAVLDAAFTTRAPPDGTSWFVWDPGDHGPAGTRFFETRWVNAVSGRLDLTSHHFQLTWFPSGQRDPALARFVARTHRRLLLIVPHPGVCTRAREPLRPDLQRLVTCRVASG